MNFLVVFAFLFAAAAAVPGEQIVSVTQDTIGNYKLKYAIDGISRVEHGDLAGNVNGGYSYIDPYGILRKTEFTAGINGYTAIGTDIPVPVQDTPEVALLKAKHLTILREAHLAPKIPEYQEDYQLLKYANTPLVRSAPLPIPALPAALPSAAFPAAVPAGAHFLSGAIPDTPEVVAARNAHFAAHAAVRSRLLH